MKASIIGKAPVLGRHIEKWKASGVSQVEYCRLNDVNIKSFRYWKRRIGSLGCAPALVEVPLI